MALPLELRTWPWKDRTGRTNWFKVVLLILLAIPPLWLAYDAMTGLWVIPIVGLIYWSGIWATILLLATLAITPLRRIFRVNWTIGLRRTLGVAALVYSIGHTLTYFALRFWNAGDIVTEVFTRLTLIVATVSLLGLFVLGFTSLDIAIKKMGAKNWDRLHKGTYLYTGLAIWHFLLSPGASGGLPYLFLGMFFWLMAWRWFNARRLGEDLRVLFGLAIASTTLTVASEAIVPALRFGMDPMMTLSFNFSLILGIAPGWHMLGWSLGVFIAAAIRQRWLAGRPARAAG